jgi:hypothetical protein
MVLVLAPYDWEIRRLRAVLLWHLASFPDAFAQIEYQRLALPVLRAYTEYAGPFMNVESFQAPENPLLATSLLALTALDTSVMDLQQALDDAPETAKLAIRKQMGAYRSRLEAQNSAFEALQKELDK